MKPRRMNFPRRAAIVFCLVLLGGWLGELERAHGLEPGQVLVVYNHFDTASTTVQAYYSGRRPGVLTCDLASEKIAGRHTIDYETFRSEILRPIRRMLVARPGLAQRVVCITLTKGIPHRIDDTDSPGIGDRPEEVRAEWLERGDFTACSVDSELTLLWQDLAHGEAGGRFDSKADGFIINPYYGKKRPIERYDRRSIMDRKRLIDVMQVEIESGVFQGGWSAESARKRSARLGPGDLYLVTRLDGPTVGAVMAMIDRAQELTIDPREVVIVLDANARAKLDRADYRKTSVLMARSGWQVIYETTGDFITGEELTHPVIAYASYGRNDNSDDEPSSTDYIGSFRFSPGAIFNTLESFNGRDFGGAGNRPEARQTQVSDFIAAGGTFGIGNVWEPFSFSAADNLYLLDAFFNRGMTFAEAAYTSLRVLSWQQVVIGDPLARAKVIGRSPSPAPSQVGR